MFSESIVWTPIINGLFEFYLLISFLFESQIKNDFYGLIVGHFYFFCKDILTRIKLVNGLKLAETPNYIIKLCEKLNINNDLIIEAEDGDLLF